MHKLSEPLDAIYCQIPTGHISCVSVSRKAHAIKQSGRDLLLHTTNITSDTLQASATMCSHAAVHLPHTGSNVDRAWRALTAGSCTRLNLSSSTPNPIIPGTKLRSTLGSTDVAHVRLTHQHAQHYNASKTINICPRLSSQDPLQNHSQRLQASAPPQTPWHSHICLLQASPRGPSSAALMSGASPCCSTACITRPVRPS